METVFFEKIKNSKQPNDCEYNIFDKDRNILANAVIFHISENVNSLDIAEIKPYIPIPSLVEKIITFSKLNKKRYILFPRINKVNNTYFEDESIGGGNIYDNHGSCLDDSQVVYGMNFIIYDYISKHYCIEDIVVQTRQCCFLDDETKTIMPMLVLKDKYNIRNPLQIRVEIMNSEVKDSAKLISTFSSICSIHKYEKVLTEKELKQCYPKCLDRTGNILDDEELVKRDIFLTRDFNNKYTIQCCRLVLAESLLMKIFHGKRGDSAFDDIFMNIFINGTCISNDLRRGFRLNKWRCHTNNNIEFIQPTHGYESYHGYDKLYYVTFTNVEFHKQFQYCDAYHHFIEFATSDKIPKLISENDVTFKNQMNETNRNFETINDDTLQKENCNSYIYLIREREFITSKNEIYKIGRTTQEKSLRINRFNAYKKGSEIILLKEVSNDYVIEIESKLIKQFNEKFIRHIDGTEYFEGNKNEMTQLIEKECSNYLRIAKSIGTNT